MSGWWAASVRINRILCGNRSEPLCSRVYRQRPSACRTAFMRAMDLLFHECRHCESIHLRWTAQNEVEDGDAGLACAPGR